MKRNDPHEEENEGYFASVSDLMVGILFMFLLLLAIFAANYQDQNMVSRDLLEACEKRVERLKSGLREALLALETLERLRERVWTLESLIGKMVTELSDQKESSRLAQKALLAEIRKSIEAKNMDLAPEDRVLFEMDEAAAVLRLTEAIPFASQKSELSEKATKTVHTLTAVLTEVLPCYTTEGTHRACANVKGSLLETVLIEGHTDSKPWRRDGHPMSAEESKRFNDDLSSSRALSVLSEMAITNPMLEVLKNKEGRPVFGISGYGQRRLRSLDEDAPNRRIDVRFILYSDNNLAVRPILDDISKILKAGSIQDLKPLIKSIQELVDQ